jgi:hypothetical protein
MVQQVLTTATPVNTDPLVGMVSTVVLLLSVCILMVLEATPELSQAIADSEILTADIYEMGDFIPDVFDDPDISPEMFNALEVLTGPND